MGMKKIRNAEVTHTGRYPHYVYEQRAGVNTLVGIEERVQVIMRITDVGPEYGREVVLKMSRTDAENFIRNVSLAVLEGREKERAMGLPDSEALRPGDGIHIGSRTLDH